MSTAVYIRVSTVGQNEAGQRAEIERWLKGNGITDAKFYVDKATGTNLDRPAFQELQTAIFNGEVKTVVVWKLDRLARSLRDGINTLADWLDKGVRLVSTTQQLDFSGMTGQLVASVLFAVAQMEQQTRKERQAAGISVIKENEQLRKQKYRGRKPGSVKVDRSRVLELHEKGLTVGEIQDYLKISRASVYRALGSTAA
jgi:DNA invertase Pin-like site-specific DNA recombinase